MIHRINFYLFWSLVNLHLNNYCAYVERLFDLLQESSHAFPSHLETIFSPSLEPIEVHIEANTDNDAGLSTQH